MTLINPKFLIIGMMVIPQLKKLEKRIKPLHTGKN